MFLKSRQKVSLDGDARKRTASSMVNQAVQTAGHWSATTMDYVTNQTVYVTRLPKTGGQFHEPDRGTDSQTRLLKTDEPPKSQQ